jgi:hypothetical protein
MKSSERQSLSVSVSTWNRDSHGLYDYESDNLERCTLRTTESAYLVRKDNQVTLVPCIPPPDYTVLAHIEPFNRGFLLQSPESLSGDCLWQVVRPTEQGSLGIPIKPGTIVKLGRVQILVSELAAETPHSPSTVSSDDESAEDQKLCKICFGSTEDQNHLISPCDCSGSVRYVHLECLQRWLTSKCQVTEGGSFTSYFWKSMQCELCKKVYPFQLSAGGRQVSLFRASSSEGQTFALELLARESHGQSVHILNTKDNTSIKLGRGHESDLRINDISVSRCHSILSFQQSLVYLKDNTSKFGTLVKLPSEVFIDLGTTLTVQTGRTVTTFQLPQ